MKRIFILLIIILLPINCYAYNVDSVKLSKCIDGDTARFIINTEEVRVRFIGVDTPESVKPNSDIEEYGKEAANYTCRKLKNAKKIALEYDEKAGKTDNYGRTLAYVFIDGALLQEQLVKNGYANVKYINKNYKYYDRLKSAEEKAIKNKKRIYSDEKKEEELENELTKYLKKYAKKILSNILREIFK